MHHHPLLAKLFRDHPEWYVRIAAEDEGGFHLSNLERLLESSEEQPIAGVEKLANDSGGSLCKLVNLTAEVSFGLLFTDLGMTVTLLRDGGFGPDTFTPDLLVSSPTGLNFLVEVTRASSGSSHSSTELDCALKAKRLPFRVDQALGHALSISEITGQGRSMKERLLSMTITKASAKLSEANNDGWDVGVVHVFCRRGSLRAELIPFAADNDFPSAATVVCKSGDTWLGSFPFERTVNGLGYASGGTTSIHAIGGSGQGSRFLEDLRKKALRRAKLPAEHRSTPFLVAMQMDEWERDPLDVLSALTGSRCHISQGATQATGRVQHEPQTARKMEFAIAVEEGWQPLLTEWGYPGSDSLRFEDFGAYLDPDAAWSRELSGVLVAHHGGRLVQWLPNPFAHTSIREPRLLEIGLSIAKLGASRDDRPTG